jgi:anti-sigma-K factor RskA
VEDIKQYIESGILELYVLNDLTPAEKLEVERMAATYPEVQKEIEEISETMELLAEEHAIEPREELRAIVLNQLLTNDTNKTVAGLKPVDEEEKKIIPLKTASNTQFYKYAFAASIALLLVSLISLFNIYNRLQDSRQQLVALQAQNQKFASQVKFQEKELNFVADTSSRVLKLKGMPFSPASKLLIAWNPKKKQLLINKKASALPENDPNHQYQLWAIVQAKPVSLGVFDVSKTDSVMESMPSVNNASAFAVTLEPRGGSKEPTMKQMMVMGAIDN